MSGIPLPPLQFSSTQALEGRFSTPVSTGGNTFNFAAKKSLADMLQDPVTWAVVIALALIVKKVR